MESLTPCISKSFKMDSVSTRSGVSTTGGRLASMRSSTISSRSRHSSIECLSSDPQTPKTTSSMLDSEMDYAPIILEQSDRLRLALEDILEKVQDGDHEHADELLYSISILFENSAVWYAALRSPLGKSDIPIVEAAKRGCPRFIEAILTKSYPFSKEKRTCLLEAPGRYGLTALQHAIRVEQWLTANMLVRYGANIGYNDDNLRIVQSLLKTARLQRNASGSWRCMDKNLSELLATINMVVGDHWATDQPPTPSDKSK